MSSIRFLPLTSLNEKSLPVIKQNFDEIENLLDGRLEEDNFAEDVLPSIVGNQYTGDGSANREIDLGFMPRFVLILNHTDGYTFESIGTGDVAMAAWWRTNAGALSSGAGDWQGITANGFKCGSNSANLSNKNGVLYSYFAMR